MTPIHFNFRKYIIPFTLKAHILPENILFLQNVNYELEIKLSPADRLTAELTEDDCGNTNVITFKYKLPGKGNNVHRDGTFSLDEMEKALLSRLRLISDGYFSRLLISNKKVKLTKSEDGNTLTIKDSKCNTFTFELSPAFVISYQPHQYIFFS